jgi:alkaline phosphatase D
MMHAFISLDFQRMSEMPSFLSRRRFLQTAASGLVLPLFPLPVSGAVQRQITFSEDPFQLGVASGEPSSDGFVIWTRLAPKPLEGGGMPGSLVEVRWEVAEDDQFAKIAQSGSTVATPQLAHSVHVEIFGLKPDRCHRQSPHVSDGRRGAETTQIRLCLLPAL